MAGLTAFRMKPTARSVTACGAALLASLWMLSIVIVNPIGDFPLVDDWAFGRSVKHLLETGEYDSTGWGWMTLVTNVLWGALFCLPAGFSFTALRMSTLVAALLGGIGVYVLMRDLKQSRWLAVLVTLMLAFNPVHYVLSLTFMTDVLFSTLLVWASIFFLRSLQTRSRYHIVIGTALAVAATLSRQLAICIPVAFGMISLLRSRLTIATALRAVFPAAICIGAYLIIDLSGMIGIKADEQVLKLTADLAMLAKTILRNTFSILIHLGLFMFPILLIAVRGMVRHCASRLASLTAMSVFMMALLVAARLMSGDEVLLPLFHNYLQKSGLGLPILRDIYVLNLDHLPSLPTAFWLAVNAAAFAGAVLLIAMVSLNAWSLVAAVRTGRNLDGVGAAVGFAFLTSAIYILLLLPSPLSFDKYVVPLIPFLAIVILGSRPTIAGSDVPRAWSLAGFLLIAGFATFAVVGTRDYLTWNRLRWEALAQLMHDRRIGPEEIDGGFEFNLLYLFSPPYKSRWPADSTKVSPWWVRRDTYLISFGPVVGYDIVKEYTYQRWLPWRVHSVLVLKKQG